MLVLAGDGQTGDGLTGDGPAADGAGERRLDPAGTVLVTGGSGVLAGLTARHLAVTGRAGRLLLTSRRGPAAPGAARAGRGPGRAWACRVQVTACDVADRSALAALLAARCPPRTR